MNRKTLIAGSALLALFGVTVYAAYWYGTRHGIQPASLSPSGAPVTPSAGGDKLDPNRGRRVLYWHDPMVPGQRFDKPGKSPFMDMQLVPVYADGGETAGDQGQASVSPRVQQNLGVRTAEVVPGTLATRLDVAGSVAFNERDQAVVQARATGYVERLHVRATLDRVGKGQALVDLYVPDWVAAQEEFLSVRRMQGRDLAVLVDAARQRMRLAGMSDDQIRLVETSGTVRPRVTLTAPVGGVVAELMVREGMTVVPGATLFRINGLATVWANAEVPESQASMLRVGSAVEARSPALPGSVFKGRVQSILPEVNPNTRTLKARIELVNPASGPGRQLAPGMFVNVSLSMPARQGLIVPTEAVIQTGKRTVVMLAEARRFRPVEVEIGAEANGQTEITRGLQAGQKVVVSGQFLLDSEASLRATTTRMQDIPPVADTSVAGASAATATAAEHTGEAKIELIGKNAVTLSHGPIPSIKWGAMTMDFAAPAAGLPPGLKSGQSVKFAFTMNKDGLPVLTRIEPRVEPRIQPGGKATATDAMEKKP